MQPTTDASTSHMPAIGAASAGYEDDGVSQFDPRRLAERWSKEIEAANKELKPFHESSRRTLQRYLDRRTSIGGVVGDLGSDGVFRQNLFWSTVQVLLSNLYAKRPKVDVSRSQKDFGDENARVAAQMVERILNNDIDKDNCDFDVSTRNGIEDNLVVGMGQMWMIYEVETQQMVLDPMTGQAMPAPEDQPGQPDTEAGEQEYESSPPHGDVDEGKEPGERDIPLAQAQPQPFEQITSEAVLSDYVHWSDFLWSPARTWEEVRWVARKLRMTKEQLTSRFGVEIAKRVPCTLLKKNLTTVGVQNDPFPKGTVYEIWDKENRTVEWYADGVGVILDHGEDPLQLKNFFPCPKPLMANLTTSWLMPTSDYHFAQDQYELIDEMTTRAAWLTRAIKAVGVYDKTNDGLKRVFQEAFENQMIPVDNWAAFVERGGANGAMDFVPIEAFATALRNLNEQIPLAKSTLYEVLGIGDIMRGMTDPGETAAAQELKAKFGGTRLELRQSLIAQWTTEASAIKAEIMVRHFQPETLIKQSNIEHTPDALLIGPALELLKGRIEDLPYRITIESDSMAAVDYAEVRDSRTQYLTSMGTFVQALTPLLQQKPEVAPFMLEMLRWGLSGFKAGKQIESVMDQAIKAAQQPSPPKQPTPMEQAEIADKQALTKKNLTAADKNTADALKADADTLLLYGSYPIPSTQMPPAQPVPGTPAHAGQPPPPPAPPGGGDGGPPAVGGMMQ